MKTTNIHETATEKYRGNLLRSLNLGRPLIHIETSDFEWEKNSLFKILANKELTQTFQDREIFSWAPYRSDFLLCETDNKRHKLSGQDTSSSLIRVLENITNLEGNDCYLIEDISHYFNRENGNIEYTTQLASYLYSFYCRESRKTAISARACIIIMGSTFDIPSILQNCLYRITPPYPDEDDITNELGLNIDLSDNLLAKVKEGESIPRESPSNPQVVYRYQPSFFVEVDGDGKARVCKSGFEENKKRMLVAFKGMRISGIQSLLSYSEQPYVIGGLDLNAFRECKERMVKDSGLLRLEHVSSGYNKYVGDIEALKKYAEEVKVIIDNRANYNKAMAMPKGILLVGPPGCGKSESSKAIADILGLPLLSLDMGKLMSKWKGEYEHNFENAIALAEAAQPCVLRIDELEKAFSGTGEDGEDSSGLRILGFFLTWMQERKSMVYLVATANNLDSLRPEFLRKGRWDDIYYLVYPSAEGMARIIESCLNKYSLKLEGYDDIFSAAHAMTQGIFSKYPKCKISGAEIADVIERAYKKQFIANYKKNPILKVKQSFVHILAATNKALNAAAESALTQTIPTAKVEKIELSEIEKGLLILAKKDSNYEIERRVEAAYKQIVTDYQRQYKPLTKEKEEKIENIVSKKYTKDRISLMKKQELSSIKLSHFANGGSAYDFDEVNIKNVLDEKYSYDFIKKLKEDDILELKMGYELNNDPTIDAESEKRIKNALKDQFDNTNEIVRLYESRGYKSASN